jgi:hypothetical protein
MAASTNKTSLPEWASHALNGVSYRKAELWKAEPGDAIAGGIVESREVTVGNARCTQLIVRVEAGSQAGKPLEPGAWRMVNCVGPVLRRWIEKDAPKAGERVAVECRGVNGRWFEYVAGVYRDDASTW